MYGKNEQPLDMLPNNTPNTQSFTNLCDDIYGILA